MQGPLPLPARGVAAERGTAARVLDPLAEPGVATTVQHGMAACREALGQSPVCLTTGATGLRVRATGVGPPWQRAVQPCAQGGCGSTQPGSPCWSWVLVPWKLGARAAAPVSA